MDYDSAEQPKRVPAAELIARETAKKQQQLRGGAALPTSPMRALGTGDTRALNVMDRLQAHELTLENTDGALRELFRRLNDIDENLANIRNAVGLDPWRTL